MNMSRKSTNKSSSPKIKDLLSKKDELEAKKASLLAKGDTSLSEGDKKELSDISLSLAACEEEIEEFKKIVSEGASVLSLLIVQGRRFNPMTGNEESKPYVQTFKYNEWQVFKENYKNLGFTIVDVLKDPFGDAIDYVSRN